MNIHHILELPRLHFGFHCTLLPFAALALCQRGLTSLPKPNVFIEHLRHRKAACHRTAFCRCTPSGCPRAKMPLSKGHDIFLRFGFCSVIYQSSTARMAWVATMSMAAVRVFVTGLWQPRKAAASSNQLQRLALCTFCRFLLFAAMR